MKRIETHLDIKTMPEVIKPFIRNVRIYNSSCSEAAQTYYIEGSVRAFLKISSGSKLYRESVMTEFFHCHGLAPAVLGYVTDNGQDYLLTEALTGEDGISGRHMEESYRLAEEFGNYLKLIHSLPVLDCPVKNRTAEMLLEAEGNITRQYCDREIIIESMDTASETFGKLKHLAQADTVIHGDYCLPNIIMQDYCLSGFVDLGNGGVGDSHYDLFWGIWTLKYNFQTDQYADTFVNAYGRDKVDWDRLELCRLLAGLTE